MRLTKYDCLPNMFVIQGTGLTDAGNDPYVVFQFHDEASHTNLLLANRADDGFTWTLADGRPHVDKVYWEGRVHTSQEITSLLIRFGRNTYGCRQPEGAKHRSVLRPDGTCPGCDKAKI